MIAPRACTSGRLQLALLVAALGLGFVGGASAQDAEPARERAARPERQEATERAPRDAALQQLRQRLRNAEISQDEARALYLESLLPGWVSERFLAGVGELDAKLAAKRVTAEQVEERKRALATELKAMAFSIDVLGMTQDEAKRAWAVQSGTLSKQAAAKAASARGANTSAWMYEHLAAADVPRETMDDVVGIIERLVPMAREAGDDFVLPEAFRPKLAQLRLSAEQTSVVMGLARKAAAMPAGKSLDLRWMRQPLLDAGVPGGSLADVLATVEKLVGFTLKSGDANTPMNAEFREWFRQRDFTKEQLQTVQGLVTRAVTDAQQNQQGIASHFARLGIDERALAGARTRLIEAGVRGEVHDPTLGVLLRAAVEAAKEGDAFELDPEYAGDLAGRGLSAEQIGVVTEVAAHLGKTLRASRNRDEAAGARGEAQPARDDTKPARGDAKGEREQR